MSHCVRFLPSGLLFVSSLLVLNAARGQDQAQPRVVEAVDNARRVTLPGNVHPLARAEFDRGAASEGLPMTRMLLLLKRSDEQEAELQDYLEKQQDKSSPNYHQWLTPQEFGTQYGPADADIQSVTQWLTGQGFTVEKVYSGKTVIEFSGTATQVRTAFGTSIHSYQVEGKTYTANASDPQIPAALAPVVAGIVSLNSFPRQSHVRVVGIARKIAGKAGLEPLFTFPNPFGSGTFYGLAPGDFATIYNSKLLLSAGTDGTGQTIAIVGETNIKVSDVQAFRQMFGLPANFTSANVILNGEDPGITSTGEEGEADLDVEWSGAVAPGATVDLVVSASTPASQGVDLSALYIIEHNLAGVMSESYGSCEAGLGSAGNAFYNSLWKQAAAQGITAMVSAGDSGSAGCDDFTTVSFATQGLAVSGLASTPYNVAVGGTDFDDRGNWAAYWGINDPVTGTSALSYIPEIPWNENCAQLGLGGCGTSAPNGSLNIVAGSGGPSGMYGKPKWQLGVTGMPNDSHRDLPDVSLFASPGFNGTGYVYCQSDQTMSGAQACDITNASNGYFDFGIVGGTSASSPAFAGAMALVNQYQAAHGGTDRQGNANYVLYGLAKKTGASCTSSVSEAAGCVFNDVTHGNSYLAAHYGTAVGTNSVACKGGSLNCNATIALRAGVLVAPTSSTTEAWTVTAGYDMVTGLGSVNINNLATKWGTVSTVATTTSLTLSPTTAITHGTGENVTVNIAVTPTSATGIVSLIAKFADGTTQGLDQFTLGANGNVSGTTKSLPGGTNYTVTAHYAGDGTNAPSDSTGVAVTVVPETSQTFIVIPTFDASGNQLSGNAASVPYGSNYFIRMYATDKNAVASTTGPPSPACYQENALTCPTGTVTLTDNGTLVGTGGGGTGIYNLNSAGYTRNLTPNLLGGTHTLVASYNGDRSYQANTGTATLTVTPAVSQIQIDSYPSRVLPGQMFQLEANVTGQGPKLLAYPSGTVTFYDGSTQIPGAVQITNGGNAQIYADIYSVSFSSPGPHVITAQYSGDSNYAASTSAPVTSTLLISTSLTQSESATMINYGQTVTLTAVMTGNSKGPAITGQIYFEGPYPAVTNYVTTPGTDANGNQMLTVTATLTPPGSETIYAIYQGDANYAASSTAGDFITVNIPDFTLGPVGGVSVVPVAGQPGSGQITITPESQTPSTVNLSLSYVTVAGYTLALTPQQVSLNGSPVTATLSLTPNSSAPGNALKRQVRRAGFFVLKRGNWWLLSLATGLGAIFLLGLPGRRRRFRAALGLSVACLLFFALGCGGGGGGTGGGGGGGGGTLQPTTITLTTSNAKVPQFGQFTITATVTASKTPTGTVSFYNFGSLIESGVSLTNNQAQMGSGNLSTSNLALYQITAAYNGDTSNRSSTSAPLTQVVTGTIPATITGNTGLDTHTLQVTVGLQ